MAQQLDVAFGVGAVKSKSAFDVDPNSSFSQQSVGGGAFTSFSGDFIFKGNFGAGGEVAFRSKQNLYQGILPFRPIFYDFNAVYAPNFGKRAGAELQAGFGGESVRFYTNQFQCSFFGGCTNFTSDNHLMGHIGGGLKLYTFHNVFVRPEVHFYFIRNNNLFSSPYATRIGASIGYTFRNQM